MIIIIVVCYYNYYFYYCYRKKQRDEVIFFICVCATQRSDSGDWSVRKGKEERSEISDTLIASRFHPTNSQL